MAPRKNPRKKHLKSKKTVGGKLAPTKKPGKKLGAKRGAPTKKSIKTKAAHKKSPARKRAVAQPAIRVRAGRTSSGRQAGDLQGLSTVERANSESVDELIEEGNPFEADAVMGVEDAENADEKEVRTHEVLEDDVPGEYLDKE